MGRLAGMVLLLVQSSLRTRHAGKAAVMALMAASPFLFGEL